MAVSGIDWLASYPKSGNTWVRVFLSTYLRDGELRLNEMMNIGMADVNSLYWSMMLPKEASEMAAPEFSLYRPGALYNILYFWEMMEHHRSPIIKTHCPNITASGVPAIPYVLSRLAIIIVRDPRDVCVSSAKWMNQSYDESIKRMEDDNVYLGWPIKHPLKGWTTWYRSWQQVAFPHLIYRYEDLLEDPFSNFKEMLEFLGWPVDEDRIRRTLDATRFSRLQSAERKEGMRENRSNGQFFAAGKWGRYRGKLSHSQIRRIEREHGELMEEFGYPMGDDDAVVSGRRGEAQEGARQEAEAEMGEDCK